MKTRLEYKKEVIKKVPIGFESEKIFDAHYVLSLIDGIFEEIESIPEKQDAIDRTERHSIAGGMNDPSDIQKEAFIKEKDEDSNTTSYLE